MPDLALFLKLQLRCDGITPSCGRCVERSIKCQYAEEHSSSGDANSQREERPERRRPASRTYTKPTENSPNLGVHTASSDEIDSFDDPRIGFLSNSSPPLAIMDDLLMADINAQSMQSLSEMLMPETSSDIIQGLDESLDCPPYASSQSCLLRRSNRT